MFLLLFWHLKRQNCVSAVLWPDFVTDYPRSSAAFHFLIRQSVFYLENCSHSQKSEQNSRTPKAFWESGIPRRLISSMNPVLYSIYLRKNMIFIFFRQISYFPWCWRQFSSLKFYNSTSGASKLKIPNKATKSCEGVEEVEGGSSCSVSREGSIDF